MEWGDLLFQFLSGLTTCMIYFLIAAGLTLILGVLKILNFAQGGIYMLGAYTTYTFIKLFGGTNLGFLLTLIIAPTAVAAFFCILEVLLLRRFYEKQALYVLLITYGILIATYDMARMIWGWIIKTAPMPPMFQRPVEIIGRFFPLYNVFLILMGFFMFFLIWFIIKKTTWGKTMRAAADDREMTAALGINVPLVFTSVFGLGAWIAAIGGALVAPMAGMAADMGIEAGIIAFIVVVIAGLGSLPGALLAAFICGEVQAFGILVLPELAIAFMYLVLVIVLIVRPWGLFGKPLIIK
ncbi:MAG: branched-chain amino acid ABC transporter permease [Dehalococcoidia bacterium]|nr:branched-chain amino acid ABC transporter permease [Dehalococcoidia bacterium]